MKKTFDKQYTNKYNERRILGVKIHGLSQEKVFALVKSFIEKEDFNLVFTPNPEICLKAEKDEDYSKVLNEADLNIPDGVGLKVGAEILEQKISHRITGVDLTKYVLNYCDQNEKKVMIINKYNSMSSPKLISAVFAKKYPKIKLKIIQIKGKDYNKVILEVEAFQPDVLLTANGAPIQEQILVMLKKKSLKVRLGIGIGGSIDFITGKQKRAPKWWRDKGIEWFYRLLKQPKRIKRITDATVKFPLKCFEWQQRMKVEYRKNVLGVIKKGEKFLIQNNKRFKDDHWQFPQGGVNKRESLRSAVLREVSEELGAPEKYFKVIKQLPIQHAYDWPRWAQLIKGYKGQSQKFFLLEYSGQDSDFDFTKEDEVQAIKWVRKEELIRYIHPKRRDSLLKILNYI